MKTPLFLLSLFVSCGLLAQTDIGVYPSTTWASTNLLVNRVLETGQVGKVVGYTATGKLGVVSGGGVPEAPLGTLLYARSNANWQPFPPGLATMQTDAPDNGLWYSRRNGEWQNFLPGGGSGTNVGGTNRLKLAALAEFRPPETNGTLLPANTATFIRVNHIFDPDGVFTGVDTNAGSFRLAAGYYAITMVIPVSVAEQGGGNVRIPFSIGLFDLTTTNDVYYQSYTVYDEDLSQYSQVFMPALITDGTHDYTIRVFNHSPTLDLVAGQAGNVVGLENHYTEIQFLKLDGIAGLPEAPINSSMYARSNEDWVSFTIPSTNGFIPEAPTDGQTYGRRGSDASWQLVTGGTSGADTNAVASVPDLATLTNLTGYTKAIVGDSNTTSQSLYQKVYLPKRPRNEWYVANPPQVFTDNPDGSTTVSGATSGNIGAYFGTYEISGTRGTMVFMAKTSLTSTLNNPGQWDETQTQWFTTQACSPTWVQYSVTFLADGLNPVNITYPVNSVPTETITFYDVRYVEGVLPMPEPFYASATEPDYVWRKVGLESMGGGAGRVVKTITVTTNPHTTTIPCDADTVIIESASAANLILSGLPTIQDGLYPGQQITLQAGIGEVLNYFTLNSDAYTPGTKLRFEGPAAALNIEKAPASAPKTVTFVWDGLLWWQHQGKYASTLEVTALPAPWPPADTNGVQVLPAHIRDQFLRELMPYLLTNYVNVFPNGPIPGTSGNPLVP